MTAGDKGTVITGTATGISLAGATAVLLVVTRANPQSPEPNPMSYAMTPTSSTTATYTTTGTEFALGGTYSVKMTVQFGSGSSSFSSPYQQIYVNY